MKSLTLTRNIFTVTHLLAMAFGLYGLVVLPRVPSFLENMSPQAMAIFEFGMSKGGALYIVLGALAVAIYGVQTLGAKRLAQFLIPAFGLSLCSELLGTSTGFPFGVYSYTALLGWKVADKVPVVIPMSWFYMGFVSYLLARAAFSKTRGVLATVGPLVLGAWLLTAWDLVLDPAMAVADPKFWVWEQSGPFFGMPLQNFAGWFGTGILFMSVARWLWKSTPAVPSREQLSIPMVIYIGNMVFASIMSIGAGLYIPVVLGVILGFLPVILIWWSGNARGIAPQFSQVGD